VALEAYGDRAGLGGALPAVCVQGFLSLSGEEQDEAESAAWVAPLGEAARRLDLGGD
jgi:hypothetical protein